MKDNRKKVLLVGQNPDCFSGNGNMLGACLEDIDPEKYDVCLFLKDITPISLIGDPFVYQSTISCKTITAQDKNDTWGKNKLLALLQQVDIDIVVFVGIDIWRYIEIFDEIKRAQERMGFIWKVLVPYDLDHIRDDWISWFNYPDQVYVYSKFGHNMIKDYVPSAKYYRPKLRYSDIYAPLSAEDKNEVRKQIFSDLKETTPVFACIANNQIRKNIYNIIKGFSEALEKQKDMILYLHLDNIDHVYSIQRIARDFKIPEYNIRHNANSRKLTPIEMSVVYGMIDCHVLPSFQEGLSWTVVESKLFGMPSIISKNTAHFDFINIADENSNINTNNVLINISPDHEHQIPLITSEGPAYILSKACSSKAIAEGFLQFFEREMFQNNDVSYESQLLAEDWIKGCNNFEQDILDDVPIYSEQQEQQKRQNGNKRLGELI